MNHPNATVVMPTKSPGMAILFTVIFGPLGMLYSTILGALVMMVVSAVVGLLTLGLGLLVTWPICVLWAGLAAGSYNRRILAMAEGR